MLRQAGCEAVGFFEDFEQQRVLLQFTHQDRKFQLGFSPKDWAALSLRDKPWTSRHRTSRAEREQAALRQGYIAVNSAIRDWVKAQITILEYGMFPFEALFLPLMLIDGRPVIERLAELKLLPGLTEPKVISLTAVKREGTSGA
jgi:hypothetical protein